MKYLFLFIFLLGCASRRETTVFLKETKQELTDIYGKKCSQSGFKVVKSQDNENEYFLITYFSNCDVKILKYLDKIEIKHWLPPK